MKINDITYGSRSDGIVVETGERTELVGCPYCGEPSTADEVTEADRCPKCYRKDETA